MRGQRRSRQSSPVRDALHAHVPLLHTPAHEQPSYSAETLERHLYRGIVQSGPSHVRDSSVRHEHPS